MPSAYDPAQEAKAKCGDRYDPVEYAVSKALAAPDKQSAELWLNAAKILRKWSGKLDS